MTANAADLGTAALGAFARAAGLLVLAIGAALAFVFAFAAAVIVALLIAGAALVMRFWPRRKRSDGGRVVLDAHRTPAGWVVETAARRK